MSEFNLIAQYFTKPTQHTDLSVGDDAALIQLSADMQLAISADMLVAGTHFFHDVDAYHVGWKSLAVNISDMAAMGANPKWATLAIALPEVNHDWLTGFSKGFFDCANAFNVDLIGGDTTRGPLTISVQIMGEVPKNKALTRSGAQVDDDIWVSDTLGLAALALAYLQKKTTIPADEVTAHLNALHLPQPRVALGLALRNIATSCIDVSDGLLSEINHILLESQKKQSLESQDKALGANIYLDAIPTSATIQKSKNEAAFQHYLLAAGDDYALCFTANAADKRQILALKETLGLSISCIGKITTQQGIQVLDAAGRHINIDQQGYNHFQST